MVRRDDITVEYQNGKKIVYMSPNATTGRALDDYKQLRAIADEVGADVRDPYDKLSLGLAAEKSFAEKMLELTQPPPFRIEDALEDGIKGVSYIHHKHTNLLGSAYYHGAVEDDLRRAEARSDARFKRESDRRATYQELFEVDSALSDLNKR